MVWEEAEADLPPPLKVIGKLVEVLFIGADKRWEFIYLKMHCRG